VDVMPSIQFLGFRNSPRFETSFICFVLQNMLVYHSSYASR
jgi:hypothetical protein